MDAITAIKKQKKSLNELINTTEVEVRFNEVDALGIVWHGHYVKYFEDGREAFGKQYGLGYLDIFNQGFVAPIVKLSLDYKQTVKYGERIIIESTFINSPAAKIVFHYNIYRSSNKALVAKGESVQVFTTPNHELYITIPPFFEKWKKNNLLI